MKLRAFLSRQRVPAKDISFKNLQKETTTLLGYSLAYILLGILIGYLVLRHPIPLFGAADFIQDFWYAIVFKLLFLLLIPAWIYFGRWKYRPQDLLLGLKIKFASVARGLLLIAFGFLLNVGHIGGIIQKYPNYTDADFRLFLGILLPLFIAGIPEELFFRGYLQTRLEKISHPFFAILISGILFTAWHLPSRFFLAHGAEGTAGDFGSILLGTGIPVLLVSIFFGWHWCRYRNLPLLILVHWAIDIPPSLSSFFEILR